MLEAGTVTANIPAADLQRAREFYATRLGMQPVVEIDEMMVYKTRGGTTFSIYATQYAGMAGHTIAQWHVADLASEVRDLQAKGIVFEHYDMPGVAWEHGIATISGMGRAAWFKDSEGNILCLDDGLPEG